MRWFGDGSVFAGSVFTATSWNVTIVRHKNQLRLKENILSFRAE